MLTGLSDAYLFGDTIELTAAPDAGWVFAGWRTAACRARTTRRPSHWRVTPPSPPPLCRPRASAWMSASRAAATSPSNPAGGVYVEATVVTLAPQPSAGWQFAGWSGPDVAELVDKGGGVWEIAMDGDKALAATFTQTEYRLATSVTGSGVVIKEPE